MIWGCELEVVNSSKLYNKAEFNAILRCCVSWHSLEETLACIKTIFANNTAGPISHCQKSSSCLHREKVSFHSYIIIVQNTLRNDMYVTVFKRKVKAWRNMQIVIYILLSAVRFSGDFYFLKRIVNLQYRRQVTFFLLSRYSCNVNDPITYIKFSLSQREHHHLKQWENYHIASHVLPYCTPLYSIPILQSAICVSHQLRNLILG